MCCHLGFVQILPMVRQRSKKKKVPADDLEFVYEKGSSNFLKCSALLRVVTRLTISFPKGNHRATKAMLVFSGLYPSMDCITWTHKKNIAIEQTACDVRFMMKPVTFNVFNSKESSTWKNVVNAALQRSREDARLAKTLSVLQLTEMHV